MSPLRLPRELASGNAVLKVLGALLLLAAVGLVALTENGLLAYRQAAQRHGGDVLDLGRQSGPEAGQHGFMVRVAGPLQVVAPPRDDEFNQSGATPVLTRRVEMFQWREIIVGGQPTYELDWVDHAVDTQQFMHPAGHANPLKLPLEGHRFDASDVQVSGFKLSPALMHALPGAGQLVPDGAALPPNLAASFSVNGNYLTTSEHPDSPRLGDLRVSWDTVPLQEVTIVGRLDGDTLVPATDATDGKGYEVQVGDRPVLDLFPDLPVPPEAVMPRRGAALLLGALGVLALLWTRRQHVSDVLLPLGISALVIGSVAGAMWLGGSSGVSLRWFGVALLGLALAAWPLWRRHGFGLNADKH
ncbi:TMEM43 family protein [Dyella sp.]|jgi:hypothetical protein|uniref:TMEM43 family protein n=1 Tax=Dyella sp. TaxID=1869338 RepID=UPI002D78BC70|nr:TMEM43 family protein [Dyella sp.]HET6433641.1 TMEM43 family protein [Dyella sp.]